MYYSQTHSWRQWVSLLDDEHGWRGRAKAKAGQRTESLRAAIYAGMSDKS